MYPVPPTPSTSDERQKGKFSHLSTNCKTLGIQFLVFLRAFVDVLGNRFRAFFSFYKTVKINLKPSGLSNKLANNMFLPFSVFLCAFRLNRLTLLHFTLYTFEVNSLLPITFFSNFVWLFSMRLCHQLLKIPWLLFNAISSFDRILSPCTSSWTCSAFSLSAIRIKKSELIGSIECLPEI